MKSSTIGIIVGVVVVLGGIVWYSQKTGMEGTPVTGDQMQTASDTETQGNPQTGTTVKKPVTKPSTAAALAQASSSSALSETRPVILVGNNLQFGADLTDREGMTLYFYKNDTKNVSNCSKACQVNWPPYTVKPGIKLTADPKAQGAVSSIVLPDGSNQITYSGMPLYYWTGDKNPGDATGNNLNAFVIATP